MKPLLAACALCCLLAGAATAGPGLWKWLDGSRRLHVSDLPPPPSVPDRDILQRPDGSRPAAEAEAAEAAAAPAPRKADPEFEARLRKAKGAQAVASAPPTAEQLAAQEEHAARQAENCKVARSYMASLDSGVRITRTNDKGEREVMDDAGRSLEAQRTKRIIAADCK